MLRVGLVGLGDAGSHHARALVELEREGVLTFAALCGRDAARADAFAVEHSLPAPTLRFASFRALLDAHACDAVILATPDGLHASQAIEALEHGLHALVEKPLALSRRDGAAVVDAARSAGAHLAVGYHLRHHAAHRLAKDRLSLVGTLRTVHARWAWPDPAIQGWRARGEAARFWSLAALGTHAIDLALFFVDAPVARVAEVRTPAGGIDRGAEVSLAFENGVLAHVSCSVAHRAQSRVAIAGDEGEIEMLNTLGARGDGEITLRPPRGPVAPLPFDRVDPYAEQLRAFARDSIPGFHEDPHRLANLEVLDAIDSEGSPAE